MFYWHVKIFNSRHLPCFLYVSGDKICYAFVLGFSSPRSSCRVSKIFILIMPWFPNLTMKSRVIAQFRVLGVYCRNFRNTFQPLKMIPERGKCRCRCASMSFPRIQKGKLIAQTVWPGQLNEWGEFWDIQRTFFPSCSFWPIYIYPYPDVPKLEF